MFLKKPWMLFIAAGLLSMASLSGGTFLSIEARTVGGSDFLFPGDALREGPALFALAMSTTRENGEYQQERLLEWHHTLMQSSVLPADMSIFHFPVIESPPFFVRGIIRRGIGRSIAPAVLEDRAAVLFVPDTREFARNAGIPLDDQPTLAVVVQGGRVAGFVKGPVSDQGMLELQRIIQQLAR